MPLRCIKKVFESMRSKLVLRISFDSHWKTALKYFEPKYHVDLFKTLKNHTKRIDLSCFFRVTCHFKMPYCLLNSQSSNCETRTFWIFKFAELVCEKSLTLMASCGRAANVIEKKLSPVAKLQILPLELLCEYLISISVLVFFLLDCDPHHSASIDTESENKYTC